MPAISLLSKIDTYLADDRAEFVRDALAFATDAHSGQSRLSGEPYVEHPIATAEFLAERRMDATTLAAALLHDVIEDCEISREQIEDKFGDEVAKLVDGVTKMNSIDILARGDRVNASFALNGNIDQDDDRTARQAASMRKMLVAMAEDVRVVLIKLADRLHNMRTLDAHSQDRRISIARETLEIYAPLAHRLGAWDLKWRLEDEAFRHLQPRQYRSVYRLIRRKRSEREQYTERVMKILQEKLDEHDIQAEVTGRPKHLYSIYQKMHRYAEQGRQFNDIQDLTALRVLVGSEEECYRVLWIAHSLWRPVPGQFDDYIASPKENLYQSIHTSVMCEENAPVEIQIRTRRMHDLAENGVASHWAYKEEGDSSSDDNFEQRMSWLRQLLDWQNELEGDSQYLDTVRTDILRDQVYVYTPMGEIKELPGGSTPLDFAYRVHTDLGHHTVSASVNGQHVPLNTVLENGDTVEIDKSRSVRGPRTDWLNPDLGYLYTASAREKVRTWFRRQRREENVQRGRELLRRQVSQLRSSTPEEEIAAALKFESADDLAEALGSGTLQPADVVRGLVDIAGEPDLVRVEREGEQSHQGVVVLHSDQSASDTVTRLARCCSPVYGDAITGYVTRERGVTVHLQTCPNLRARLEPERSVEVAWGHLEERYASRLKIDAWDRVGLLRDLTAVVSREKANIHRIHSSEQQLAGRSTVELTVYTSGVDQLTRLCARLDAVPGVQSVQRQGAG
ncbi:MAG: bifunctional (p)ppGpp synthetase/guanosine-3',5'-bis(diphosphate) 3'-pyrophosphohydrolase [Chloroflexi bacterium]|jgi:GTP diphosphokinase / guanosine-3',5'-bis(diphosphate) 3'-diphosphatase|nr:bifunctional (p)ppGpp synthetase/guanosine-3',5'-bis(diphosphate) 3'-pyrophosphohydrolase [Chloroflexota bacterium]MBT4074522.1 bifunctional (p)ppGpp synthetase/guanosine-3',5'-bis(diphosphate) 3'-pyrophosphohydrolase [Chloroflexota bacterium]MBT4513550.1 bifunctional (p)ppGpp synthetase/guanosine-3',5'-bis(diphosphate) 3'-pyrophosphohydrolase [Chloroflexota bacterium]MBT5320502.1 bifunctional (p)ppGpp synthetase/guanosine-3',5'-bis(diphosphate) 3'-pyrophosphohydrolase [Chloroflexota bacteriu